MCVCVCDEENKKKEKKKRIRKGWGEEREPTSRNTVHGNRKQRVEKRKGEQWEARLKKQKPKKKVAKRRKEKKDRQGIGGSCNFLRGKNESVFSLECAGRFGGEHVLTKQQHTLKQRHAGGLAAFLSGRKQGNARF